ncbi:MAG: beta-N-acetylhexosaminidase [Ginsengibacter sp.]
MKKIFLFSSLFISLTICGQMKVVIVPKPVSLEMHSGSFEFNSATKIIADKNATHEAQMLNVYLKQLYGVNLLIKNKITKHEKGNFILFKLETNNERKDAYRLLSDPNKIIITSAGNEGLFYGLQTLLQLLPETKTAATFTGASIPALSIKDYPRFQYRGMHLDVGRHFFDVGFIKKYIDYLAYHKYNNFHWHLTEDQGWRIEIKKYPLLTSVGGFRNGTIIGHTPGTGNDQTHYGGFYTQDEIKDIVKYAQDRFITIIPEIEMPGHASAAIAAYPQLSCFPNESTKISSRTPWAGSRDGKQVQQTWGVFEDVFTPTEYTFKFLENVLDEVMKLFPSKYIHIGGDECPKTNWERSEFCQQLIKDKNLKDAHGLQSYFIQRIEKYLNSKGRKMIGWDEILEGGLAQNATVMSWRGEEGGIAAARQHHNVIMTPGKYVYLDHAQIKDRNIVTIGGYLPLDTVYNYEPIPKELADTEAHFVLGAQANVWTEYMADTQKVEYMIFPRMSALSEVLWSPKDSRDFERFKSELPDLHKRYELWDANYFKE